MDPEQNQGAKPSLPIASPIGTPDGLEPIPTLQELGVDSSWQTDSTPIQSTTAELPIEIPEEPKGLSRFLPTWFRRRSNDDEFNVIDDQYAEPVDLTPDPPWKTFLKTCVAFVLSAALAYIILTFPSQMARAAYFFQHLGKSDTPSKIVDGTATSGSFKTVASLSFVAPIDTSTSNSASADTTSFTNLDDNQLYIPKISVKSPIVWDSSFEEKIMLSNLQKGVVHYGGTDFPSKDKGNVFITGHSSYYWWDSGKYKTVFALLDNLKPGDQEALTYQNQVYVYQVYDKIVVKPSQTDVLNSTDKPTLSLMTCTPVGTSLNRLIVRSNLVGVYDQNSSSTTTQPTTSTTETTTPSTPTTSIPATAPNDVIQLLPGLR